MREDCKNYGSSFCVDFECSKCPVLELKGTVVEKKKGKMTEQELKKELDKILCEFIDPNIPYEEQSAPLLDSSWSYVNRIHNLYTKQAGYVQIRKGDLYFSREQLAQPDPAKDLYDDSEDKEGK